MLKISPIQTPDIEIQVERELPDFNVLIRELAAAGTLQGAPVGGGGGSGSDTDALHKNTGGEINSLTEKTTAVSNDLAVIEDSQSSNNKKKVKLSNLSPNALHTDKSSEISGITEKTSPVNDDLAVIEDSAVSNTKKRAKLSNLSPNALHIDRSSEISGLTEKTSPVGNDLLVIEDSASSNTKKKVKLSNLPADTNAIHKNTASEISTVSEKLSPVGDDLILIEDSAASNAKKRVKLTNIRPVSYIWQSESPAISGTHKRFYVERSGTITEVRPNVVNGDGTVTMTLDVLKNATSIYPTSTKPNIPATNYVNGSFTPDTAGFSDGDYFQINITNTGNTNGPLRLVIKFKET